MKRRSRARLLSALLTLAMVLSMLPAAWAAEGDGDSGPQDDKATLSITGDKTVKVESEVILTVSASGGDTLSEIKWSISPDSDYAEIVGNDDGTSVTIRGTAAGEVSVSCTAKVGEQTPEPATHTLTVEAKDEPIAVDGVSLDIDKLTLKKGETETLTATVSPENAANKEVTWSSDYPEIASVDNGQVTAVAVGKATITVTTKDGNYKDTCEVNVEEDTPSPIPVSKVVLPSADSEKKKKTLDLGSKVSFEPSDATVTTLTWTTSASDIATVNASGVVTGLKAGTANITATAASGVSATCSVTVTAATVAVTGVSLNKTSATVNVNGATQLTATVSPSSAANKKVTWKSSNTGVATVDSSGKVTGKAVGEATITVTTADGGKTAACKVTVSKGSPATITYSVAVDKTLTLDRSDFYNVCANVYGNGLEYVKFDRNVSKGTLYFDYTESGGGSKISTSTKYAYSNSASRPISQITFVPDGSSGDTAVFTYDAWDTAGRSYEGRVEIKLTAPSGDLSYETSKDTPITFTDSDFNDICKKITGSSLDYVTFGSVSSSRGALYYDYGGKNEDKLSTSTKCYYNDDPYLSNVTFVPDEDYTGTFTISYSGRSNARDSFSGKVEITVRKSSSVLSYTVAEGKTLTLDDSDFNDFCKDETGHSLDYVKITPPSSSKGTFYYRYGESRYEEEVDDGDKYYRSSSPRLDDVTFVPDEDYSGTFSVSFTGRSTDGEDFSGTLKIRVGDADKGDITYNAAAGAPVTFDDGDFNDYCKDVTGDSLDYVRFTLPSASKGVLYYRYDESGEKKVSSSTSYYRSSSPRLYDVTFVPDEDLGSGSVELSFTGRSDDGESFSGAVVIRYAAPKEASVIRYATTSAPVSFRSSDFVSACAARGAGSLVSVKFELPSTAAGKLYYGYAGPNDYGGLVSPSISFPASTSSGSISAVTFVPKAAYNGTVTITYTGTDSKDDTFTGKVELTVTPSTQSRRFTDMGGHGWAAPSVDFLYESGVTTGTSATTYGPAANITRGDFILMLYRAFDLNASASGGFPDVPGNSYYAQAIAVAKALGIAQGGDDGRFRPADPLTREDAMVFLYRTLSRTGRTLAEAPASYLNRFSDGGSTSSYAQGSVAALVQAGVIQGDNNGRLNPKGSLTRAEMAVILHRVLTL